MPRETLGFLLGFIGVVVFGATLPMTRLAIATFDPLFLTFARAAGAGILASAALLARPIPLPRGNLGALLAIAATLVIGFPLLSGFAMTSVPAAHGGVVLGILPLATVVASTFINNERPSALFWIAAIAGGLLVVLFALRDGDFGQFATGDFWLALSAISAAIGYAFSGRLARTFPGWAVISWALVLSLPLTALASIFLWRPAYLEAPPDQWAALAYLAVFSMFIGFFAWNAGLAMAGVARVSQVQLLQTFVTLAIAAILLGETIDTQTILFALAVAAIVFVGRRAPVLR